MLPERVGGHPPGKPITSAADIEFEPVMGKFAQVVWARTVAVAEALHYEDEQSGDWANPDAMMPACQFPTVRAGASPNP